MKKILLFIILSTTLFLSGCENFFNNPNAILSNYLNNSLHGKYEEAYKYLSPEDKSIKSLQEYSGNNEFPNLADILTKNTTYKIKDIVINGDRAKATVDITTPDASAMMADILGIAFSSAFDKNQDPKELEKKIVEKYKDKQFPMVTNTQTYTLVKSAEGWKVFLNLDAEKKLEAAKKLEETKKIAEAKTKYEEVLTNYNNNFESPEKIKELTDKIAVLQEKLDYFSSLNIKKGNISSYFGFTMLKGEIKNTGNKILKKVEITVYCLDKAGQIIFEKTDTPVFVVASSFGDDNIPLKPNYSTKYIVDLSNAPSEWAKKVDVKVTNIEFQE